jgi:hypothetical protein
MVPSDTMDRRSPCPRPWVQHELYASLRPQSYDQDMSRPTAAVDLSRPKMDAKSKGEWQRLARPRSARSSSAGNGVRGYGGESGGMEAASAPREEEAAFDMSESIAAVANAGEVGELFRYDIDMPVSIKRQRSAMLPIVNQAVETSKVSIYNQSVHAKHPLNGIRLKNTSDLHLMQGPITLFDGGVYAGDAKIPDLPAGSERLVSYAIDLDVEVAQKHDTTAGQLVAVKLVNGVMHATHKYSRSWSYTIKNSGDQPKKVLVEHPLHNGWELVEPKQAAETTRDRHRFEVEVLAGLTTELKIEEERLRKQVFNFRQLGTGQGQFYLSSDKVSEEIKVALREIQRRQAAYVDLNRQRQQRQKELAAIDQEQARIRKNMQQLPHDSELHKRYIKKFTEQEDAIERLRAEMQTLQAEAAERQKELREYMKGLDIE